MTAATQQHTHQPVPHLERGPYGFTEPVAGDGGVPGDPPPEYNPRAHGNVMMIEVCSCGWERRVLVNHPHYEYGRWRRSQKQREEEARREAARRRREERLRQARGMLYRGHDVMFGEREVSVAPGIRIVLATGARPEDLLEDDTTVQVVLDGPYQRHRVACRLGDLRRAGAEWRDGPEGDPRTTIYPAIARALP